LSEDQGGPDSLARLKAYIEQHLASILAFLPQAQACRVPPTVFCEVSEVEFLQRASLTKCCVPVPNLTNDPDKLLRSSLQDNFSMEDEMLSQKFLVGEMDGVMSLGKEARKKLLADSTAGMERVDKLADTEIRARMQAITQLTRQLENEIAKSKENVQFEREKAANFDIRIANISKRSKDLNKKALGIIEKLQKLSPEHIHDNHKSTMMTQIENNCHQITSVKSVIEDVVVDHPASEGPKAGQQRGSSTASSVL
jgi:hypothetical protein